MIAETKSFAYWSNAKPDGPLESIVHDQVVEATDQLRITVSEGKTGPNVMRINFSPAKVGNVTNMMISAEWTYTGPDGKPVIVWADTQQVPAISSATSQDHAMSMLREGLSNLLKRFADDVARLAQVPRSSRPFGNGCWRLPSTFADVGVALCCHPGATVKCRPNRRQTGMSAPPDVSSVASPAHVRVAAGRC